MLSQCLVVIHMQLFSGENVLYDQRYVYLRYIFITSLLYLVIVVLAFVLL